MKRSALIVLNGSIRRSIKHVVWSDDKLRIAADGALNTLLDLEKVPDVVIGDFDSVHEDDLDDASRLGTRLIHIPDQETSDSEKAIGFALGEGCTSLEIIGHLGTRFDHILAVLEAVSVLRNVSVSFIDRNARGMLLRGPGESVISRARDHTCSLMPIRPCTGVTLTGFRWSTQSAQLGGNGRFSLSNIIVDDQAVISLESGLLMIYLHH